MINLDVQSNYSINVVLRLLLILTMARISFSKDPGDNLKYQTMFSVTAVANES